MSNKIKHGKNMNERRKSAASKAEFIRLAGIGPELAEFLTGFSEKSADFFSMPFERRKIIENQMDEILSSLAK